MWVIWVWVWEKMGLGGEIDLFRGVRRRLMISGRSMDIKEFLRGMFWSKGKKVVERG